MRPVSAAWESSVRGSHDAVFRATVCDTYQTGTSPTGEVLPVQGGSVRLDGSSRPDESVAIRSTLDWLTDGTRMWPRRASDPLAPYGNEVYIERGIKYNDALVEMVGLGYFRIKAPDQDDAPDEQIRVEGEDRMQAIIDGRLLQPVQYPVGTTLGDIFDELVLDVYPSATIEWDDDTNTVTLTRSVIVEEDRFGFLDDVVRAQGKMWYWDHRGVLVIKDLPDDTNTVFEINSGKYGVEVKLSRHITREGVYNAWVVTGEGGDTDNPIRGSAVDGDTNSPTYFLGRFGKVPGYYTSPLVTTQGQADAAAAALLRSQLGLPYVVNFGMVPNPALEPFDPVLIRYSTQDSPERHVLASLSIPLDENAAMTGTTRQKAVVLVGKA